MAGVRTPADSAQAALGPALNQHQVCGESNHDRTSILLGRIGIYDNFPGSIGLSPALFDLEKDLLRHGLKTINVCPCQEGCPSCVGPSRETGRQAKQVAQEILRGLLEE